MSLIKKKYDEGQTDLNQLRYAPNRGPLVQKRIPTGQNPSAPASSEIQTRANDLTRIASLMTRKEGLGYLTNNTILNTSIEQSYTVQGTLKDKLKALGDVNRGEALRDTLGTLATTLAQVPVAGTGTHFIKGKLFGKPNTSFNNPSSTTKRIGDPGSVKVKYGRDNYFEQASEFFAGTDKVNNLGPYKADQPSDRGDDYIKFFFEIMQPGEKQNTYIHLRAFLDSFNDNFSSSWNSFNYVGRGEQFYTYQNFNRSIDVSFKTAIATKVELQPVYKKLVYLASTTAPTYSNTGLMRGTVVRLNIGDYLSDTPGFFTNVTYSWEPSYPFEIALGKKDGPKTRGNTDNTLAQELPHVLNCSFTFTPIHTFTPQTGLHHYITNPADNDSQFFPVKEESDTSNTVTENQQENLDRLLGNTNLGSLGSGF